MFEKKEIVSLIDLTYLDSSEDENAIKLLSEKSVNSLGKVAAICIPKELIPYAKELDIIKKNNIKVATVINFPHGNLPLNQVLQGVQMSLENGADEIDVVFPYHLLLKGTPQNSEGFVKAVKRKCHNLPLKVIIETGKLQTEKLIRLATKISINDGADFIKTSTGMTEISATIEAASFILDEIKNSNTKCGFKASGGIKTYECANSYLELAQKIMGKEFISPTTLRIGASSLLDNLLNLENN